MILRLSIEQIPALWENIKYGATMANKIQEKDVPTFARNLLVELLNDQSQGWIRFGPERLVTGTMTTRIEVDKYSGEKTLRVTSAFSYAKESNEELFDKLRKFAKATGCVKIIAQSSNQRVHEILEEHGMKEVSRHFSCDI